ncbi:contractile injection system tape measure protein [Tropicimonas sp. TH_r6]|uniref:contractile injection system tape measure protein n=1 Tax=Tropicimonas sp. TH_r6 TaxID=3082085 RepID=UPI0029554224|nr:contractile injection system tape measure protein [Tropicimonas sp. TH_r6]MDV7144025.1 contractile injection system tape measure protein [Tropicimonas sp. TH_r6]
MAQAHHIGRMRFEMSAAREGDLLGLRQKLEAAARHRLQEALARRLDQMAGSGEVLHFDRLEVDLGTLPPGAEPDVDALAEAVADAIIRAAGGRIETMDAAGDPDLEAAAAKPVRQTIGQARLRAFLTYLAQGVLPAFVPERALDALVAALFEAPDGPLAMAILQAVHRHPSAARRVLKGISAAHLLTLLALAETDAPQELAERLRETSSQIRAGLAADGSSPQRLATLLTEFASTLVVGVALPDHANRLGNPQSASTPPDAVRAHPGPEAPEDETAQVPADLPVPVADAGLVLLWPFLPHLLENLALDISDEGAPRAAQVLHFLARGRSVAQEPDLLIARILLNIPGHVPLLEDSELPPDMQEECGKLLQAVIGHWNKLGRTSPDALRETFLQRPGLYDATAAQISVETRGTDALLASIPWSLGSVMLPWLDRPIKVAWA